MSQTAEYGDTLISGILSGQKFRQFQSDLKTSELQRQMLEQQMGFQATMQPLALEHQRAQIEGEKTRNITHDLINKFKEATFASGVAENEANALTAKSNASRADTEADVSAATAGDRKSSAKSEAAWQKARLLQEQLKLVGESVTGDTKFTPEDYNNLMDEMGVVPEKGTRELTAKLIAGQVSQAQQRHADNQAKIALAQESARAQMEARRGMMVSKIIQGGSVLSDMAAQNPEGYAAARAKLAEMYGEDVTTVADLAVESARRKQATAAKSTDGTTVVTESPFEKTLQTKSADTYAGLREQLMAAKRAKKELEAGRRIPSSEDGSTFGIGGLSRKELIEQQQSKIDELQAQMEEIKSTAEPVSKTTAKISGPIVNKSKAKAGGYSQAALDYAKSKGWILKPKPTQAEIDEMETLARQN